MKTLLSYKLNNQTHYKLIEGDIADAFDYVSAIPNATLKSASKPKYVKYKIYDGVLLERSLNDSLVLFGKKEMRIANCMLKPLITE